MYLDLKAWFFTFMFLFYEACPILCLLKLKTSSQNYKSNHKLVSLKHKSCTTYLTATLLDVSWRSLGSKSWDSLRPSSLQPLKNKMILSWEEEKKFKSVLFYLIFMNQPLLFNSPNYWKVGSREGSKSQV